MLSNDRDLLVFLCSIERDLFLLRSLELDFFSFHSVERDFAGLEIFGFSDTLNALTWLFVPSCEDVELELELDGVGVRSRSLGTDDDLRCLRRLL